jgi:hypothetical protein
MSTVDTQPTRTDFSELLVRTLAGVRERVVALAIGTMILALGVLGSLRGGAGLHGFDLDAEKNIPSAFSAALPIAAGILALVLAPRVAKGRQRLAWYALAGAFVWMGFDEFAQVHETLERITGIDWQILYAPLVVVIAVAWFNVLRTLWPVVRARLMLIGGAAAWFLAQIIEQVQWNGDQRRSGYTEMMGAEELLEMAGSALFLLSMLAALRALGARGEAGLGQEHVSDAEA